MPIDEAYVEVADRIREFRDKYPGGSLRPVNVAKPFEIVNIGDLTFIVYVALALRGPEDINPGVGSAWVRFPGLTNYTRNSELQNAETSAWGRAIIASLGADARRIATAEDVRNAEAEAQQPARPAQSAQFGRRRRPPPSQGSSPRVKAIKERLSKLDEEHFAWTRTQAKLAEIPPIDGEDIRPYHLDKLEELITLAEIDQQQLPFTEVENEEERPLEVDD